MDAQGWVMIIGALVTLVGAIAGGVALVVAELRKGRIDKQDPEVEGSGAKICALLEKGQEEQRRFNLAMALHLGMGAGLVDGGPGVREAATREGNGR